MSVFTHHYTSYLQSRAWYWAGTQKYLLNEDSFLIALTAYVRNTACYVLGRVFSHLVIS